MKSNKKRLSRLRLDALLLAGCRPPRAISICLPRQRINHALLQKYEPSTETLMQAAFIKEQALVEVMRQLDLKSYSYIKKI